jgi:hypothetical protein
MYEINNCTNLFHPSTWSNEYFQKVLDERYADTASASLPSDALDRATMTVLREVAGMLDRRDYIEFFTLWGQENDFCPLLDYFFFINPVTHESYIILEVNDAYNRITLWDYEIGCFAEEYLKCYGTEESRAKWVIAQQTYTAQCEEYEASEED